MKLRYVSLAISILSITSAAIAENKYKLKAPSSLAEMKNSGIKISVGEPINGLNMVESYVIGTSDFKKCEVKGVNLNWYQPGKMIVLTVPIKEVGDGDYEFRVTADERDAVIIELVCEGARGRKFSFALIQ